MTNWELRTILPEIGKVAIAGIVEGGTLTFYHPRDEGEIVLRVTLDRATELLTLSYRERQRMNLQLERSEIYTGRDCAMEPLKTLQCPHCYSIITWIDSDFLLHSIPWCPEWRKTHPKG